MKGKEAFPMEKRWEMCGKWIAGVLALVLLCVSVLTVHDMQTAEGVGLYFALKSGADRRFYDLAADGLAGLGLLLLTLLPCVALRHRGADSFFRMLAAFLALMPRLSMAYLLHIWDDSAEISSEIPVFLLLTMAPFLCIAAMALVLSGRDGGEEERPGGWRMWYSPCLAGAVISFGAALLWPELNQLLYFVMGYLLLLVCFDLWERVYGRYPAMRRWGWILSGGLAVRAVYALSQVMNRY